MPFLSFHLETPAVGRQPFLLNILQRKGACGTAGGAGTFGGELVSALMGPDARATSRAVAVLADLLRGNTACKQQVVTLLLLKHQKIISALKIFTFGCPFVM